LRVVFLFKSGGCGFAGDGGAFFCKPAASKTKTGIETNKITGREPARPLKMFSQGFWIGAGNPKAIAFFGALFPQFIDATRPLLPQILVLGITFVIFDYTAVMVYATAASRITP
tara:strand:- start:25930 stop:26271 length:342 start_codon:yes stop_codon:yes gene_type:complete